MPTEALSLYSFDRKYRNVSRAVYGTPWATTPEHLEQIVSIVQTHMHGGAVVAEVEYEAKGGERPQPAIRGSVAVIPLHGTLMQRAGLMTDMSGGTSAEAFGAMFDDVMADEAVRSVIIDVDSPGGEVYGVPEVAERIFAARGKKRITAVANSVMASGAYWIGCQADEIWVTPSGEAGSIGVIAAHQEFSKADEQMGVKTTLIHAGKFKTEGNPHEPLSDEATVAIQKRVDDIYGMFVRHVSRARGVSAADVRGGYGQGRCLGAKDAVQAGLADRVSTLSDAISSHTSRPGPRASNVRRRMGAGL